MAGNKYISVGDLKEGFNQCDNEPDTAEKMAVLVASGSYLPKGLTFGSTNGPEDFEELVFVIFSRRLYKEWFLFLDDLSVATGRPPPPPPGGPGKRYAIDGGGGLAAFGRIRPEGRRPSEKGPRFSEAAPLTELHLGVTF